MTLPNTVLTQTNICSDIYRMAMVPISSIVDLNYYPLIPYLPETLKIMRDNEHKEVTDKYGNVITHGDYVSTRIRGGTHEGRVSKTTTYGQPFLGVIF